MKTTNLKLFSFFISALLAIQLFSVSITAQETKFRQQAWRYGANLALQTNSAALGWQQLHGTDFNFHSPNDNIDYVDGTGMGIYIGFMGEYLSESWWGLQLRLSYDQRDALVIDDTRLPIPSFDTKLSYLTFEPLFRVDQLAIPNLNFYAGPYLAFNIGGSFVYKADKDLATEEASTEIVGLNGVTYGAQAGVAYDINISDLDENTSLYLSPFAEASWIVNQKGLSNDEQNSVSDVWSTGSYRFGVRFSYEQRDPLPTNIVVSKVIPSPVPANKVFVVMPTENTILTKNIKGYFPIHPYVFFDKGSWDIPRRYITLTKAEATNFKESDLENFIKGDLTTKQTNVDQLMVTYYNVMNVFADRMRRNPSEKLVLRATDPDELDALIAGGKVKDYLVNNFGIHPDRISVVIEPPRKVSGSDFTEAVSKALIDDENRRVEFLFTNADMLKPIPYTIRDESSIDNDMIFSIGGNTTFKSWDISITGEGRDMYFGPYSYSSARINPSELMRFLQNGKYNAKVTITDRSGKKTEENVAFKLTKDTELKNASRYLMLFDYNESDAIESYATKIRREITPGVEPGSKVIIHGHTDIIGTEEGNLLLSQKRADIAKKIMDDEFAKEKRSISVRAIGLGQEKLQYTFDNKYPEGRMYNRNIFVEVIK